MKNYIYHIRYKEDNNNIDKGYIGLTNNPKKRKAEHFSALNLNVHKNYKLQKAFNERPDDIEFIIYKEFKKRNEASLLEETIRPLPNIGWNIAVGGEREYTERFKQKIYNIENEFIDENLLQEMFVFKNCKFSILNKIMRILFKNIINRFIASKQVIILNNIFLNSNFLPHKSSMDIIIETWAKKEDIFFGNWGALPNNITSVAYAISIQMNDNNLDILLRTNYFILLSNLVNQLFINGKLFNLNQVDAILIDIIIIDYFLLQEELLTRYSVINEEISNFL
jgi:predicted GIY-YIG superfamily endonuclease